MSSCLMFGNLRNRVWSDAYGDIKSVGGQVSEMRVFVGAGYRLYFTIQGQTIIFMLCGGDKSTQQSDIKTAQAMIANLEYDEVDNNENE